MLVELSIELVQNNHIMFREEKNVHQKYLVVAHILFRPFTSDMNQGNSNKVF